MRLFPQLQHSTSRTKVGIKTRTKMTTKIMMRMYRGRAIEEHNFKDKGENKDWDKDEEESDDNDKDEENHLR